MDGGFQLPSRIEGGVSLGQYSRIIGTNLALGAGSQLASFALPGESAWRYRSTEPSALLTNLLRWLRVYRLSGLGTKKYAASYIVRDQKPLTGGICPLSKCNTYFLEAASKSLPLPSFCPVG